MAFDFTKIIAEETKFKEKFMTKIFGYNNN